MTTGEVRRNLEDVCTYINQMHGDIVYKVWVPTRSIPPHLS